MQVVGAERICGAMQSNLRSITSGAMQSLLQSLLQSPLPMGKAKKSE